MATNHFGANFNSSSPNFGQIPLERHFYLMWKKFGILIPANQRSYQQPDVPEGHVEGHKVSQISGTSKGSLKSGPQLRRRRADKKLTPKLNLKNWREN